MRIGLNPRREEALSVVYAPAPRRRDLPVIVTLITAVMLLIWNGSALFRELEAAGDIFGPGLKIAWAAITLNVALILFGWRRYVDLQHDAIREVESEEREKRMASTDTMTGLLNRKGFGDEGGRMCEAAIAEQSQLVIFSIQLHRFKAVNDRHGFDIGDAVLGQIAEAILECAPDESVVARVSGDEFAVAMLRGTEKREELMTLGSAFLQSVTRPFEEQGKFVQIGAFVGVAAADPGECALHDLLRRADIAMDHARSSRSARPSWFDAGMERALILQGELEQGVRAGIEHDQFVPFFEPQVDLDSGEIRGFEVLARWIHPSSGMIGPDRFIPIAEELGLIGRLSDQVVRKALLAAVDWDPSISLSINISPSQLADSWLAQKIVRLLTETGFPAERLVVEVTESSLFADLELARSIVTSLKAQGIRLALDDFGSGFSSLSHLRALPFDLIKIDRSFTAAITRDRESAAIVSAVATLAKALDVPVVVEGIENAVSHEAVLQFGCRTGQGWYFGKPMSADDARQLLRLRKGGPEAVALSA
ncbi:bifunctional diguanylate cyclase/phosphodiesterase [Sphingomonas sp. ASV193]|uniref:putative bifunctional diguanylate cyclase/phosphodiesterase n=1 Tax=Sphingomonas sp. ASV193 TaxID=3144405 RepID=UPI0032E88B55